MQSCLQSVVAQEALELVGGLGSCGMHQADKWARAGCHNRCVQAERLLTT